MKLIKLTNKNAETKNNTKWVPGQLNLLPEIENPKLCCSGVYHAYRSLNLGLLLNPIDAHIPADELRIFEVEGEIVVGDRGKVGCFSLLTTSELPIPKWFEIIETRIEVQKRLVRLLEKECSKIFSLRLHNRSDVPLEYVWFFEECHNLKYICSSCPVDPKAVALHTARAIWAFKKFSFLYDTGVDLDSLIALSVSEVKRT